MKWIIGNIILDHHSYLTHAYPIKKEPVSMYNTIDTCNVT